MSLERKKPTTVNANGASNTTASTQFLQVNGQSYAYRRFGRGSGPPLLFLQHFTGTLDNWDPAVTDPLASTREVILLDNAGVGRSTGEVRTGRAIHGRVARNNADTRARTPTLARTGSQSNEVVHT